MTEQERALALTEELIDFISDSPVSYWVIRNAVDRLEADGYERLDPQHLNLKRGGRFYLTLNGSTLIAFRLPTKDPNGFMVTAAHSDSPLFKLKPNFAVKACDRYMKLNTEVYGGSIYSSWFDRPLSIAGRVVVREGDALAVRHVRLDEDLCLIPNVCIHFNREINNGYKYNPAVDTLPLIGNWTDEPVLMQRIADAVGAKAEDVVSGDLFLYNHLHGTVFGLDKAFFAAPRIDDQQCAFASLKGFLASEDGDSVPVMAIFDNEEVGSTTKQGAASDFLRDALKHIAALYGIQLSGLLPTSMLLSADNAHAMHPNHPELSDAQNAPHMNGGIVIKHNARQRYATDAVSEALFLEICKKAQVPVQHFTNRSDVAGGWTLGGIASARVSMNTADIGLAQLAMHSACETAGVMDTAYLVDAFRVFFASSIHCDSDGVYRLL